MFEVYTSETEYAAFKSYAQSRDDELPDNAAVSKLLACLCAEVADISNECNVGELNEELAEQMLQMLHKRDRAWQVHFLETTCPLVLANNGASAITGSVSSILITSFVMVYTYYGVHS